MRDINRTLNPTVAVGKIFHLANGTIQSCNANACEILGYSFEQLVGTSLFELPWQVIQDNDSTFVLETHPAIASMQTARASDNLLMGFNKPSGDLIRLSIDTLPLYKANDKKLYGVEISFIALTQATKVITAPRIARKAGNLKQISNICQNANITNLKQKTITSSSERRLKLAIDASGIGMWFWDLIEDVVQWTELGKTIFGLSLDEKLNFEKCFETIHPEDRNIVKAAIDKALADRTQYSIECRVIWSDSSVHWTAVKGRGIYNQNGKPVSMISIVQDISDRQVSQQALEQREYELELITEVIPQQIWTAGEDGHIDYINQRWKNYTGLDLAQMKTRGWATIVHPEDLPTIRNRWIQSIRTGEKFDMEVRLRDSEGTYRWFLSKARPLRNKRGEITTWYGTNTNINRIKELEEKLRQQTQDLIKANQLKDDFLAIVSHELRTPLNPILGWSQLLAGGRLDPDKIAQGLTIIERNAKLQAQLIDDLLDVSRILRGKLKLKITPLNLEFIIRSAISTVLLAASAKSIEIETRLESNVGQVLGDAGRLQQIVWNLLVNAIKFTPANGRIFVKLKRASARAVIEIKDTGRGIEPEFIPYAFDRFRQESSANTREFGGLGLGLAIVKHLTELHGGTVGVSSPGLGKGATFNVKLPLMNISISESIKIDSLDQSLQQNRFDGSTILVVDDEADSLDILTLVLEQEGAEVISTASAQAALKVFAQKTPDLIVSDIGMPDTDGYAFIKEIRKLPQGQNIPAIALTAYAGEIYTRQSLNSGFQKHIDKPIDIPQFIQAVTKLL